MKWFDFSLAAIIAAVVTNIVIFQEPGLSNPDIFAMASIGSIAGIIGGLMKMFAIDGEFNKWSLLSYILGVVLIYASVSMGVLFRF